MLRRWKAAGRDIVCRAREGEREGNRQQVCPTLSGLHSRWECQAPLLGCLPSCSVAQAGAATATSQRRDLTAGLSLLCNYGWSAEEMSTSNFFPPL
ncbi:hypothetical protein E2C01_051878 [Portunus trituberculatus]|uniref:Uncharacterized protein n=1 Tax=Portunus trituberculatus TaxID=210409 RepID=A0A5B7GLM5_PORTR|nr:hypothetical protein [Portunus trituberculatus]